MSLSERVKSIERGAAYLDGQQTSANNEQEISKLAALPVIEYEKQRKKAAQEIDVRVVALDREVSKLRASNSESSGQAMEFEDLEPWTTPVDGADLLNEIVSVLRRYIVLPEGAAEAIALWIVHTYALHLMRISPILALTSPEKRCGKTTVMSLLLSLAHRALPASNISPASLFRTTEKWRPTLLIDEADAFLKNNEELRGILNSGHTRDMAFVIRTVGDDHEPCRFSTWAPKAIACIGNLSATLMDRAILVLMRRKKLGETVERLNEYDGKTIRRQCLRWVKDNESSLRRSEPEIPRSLHDRAADNWTPLLAIADIAGGEWPKLARQAAQCLTEADIDDEGIGIQLLADAQVLFEEKHVDRISSSDLAEALGKMEERPWGEWGRSAKLITPRQITRLLKPFHIKARTHRFPVGTSKGYLLEDFQDAFERYLFPLPTGISPVPSVTRSQSSNDAGSSGIPSVTREVNVTEQNDRKPAQDKDCYRVTDQTVLRERVTV